MITVAFATVSTAQPTHAAVEVAAWRVSGDVDHEALPAITLSRATVDGVDCFRGTATTDLPADVLLEIILDIPSHPRWSSARLEYSRTVASDGSGISYVQVIDVPGWTLAFDRFWFLRGVVERSATRRALRWTPLPADAFPSVRAEVAAAHPGAVEPPVNVGAWIFDRVPTGTAITYYVCSDAGGSMPVVLQNSATTRTLPDTMGDLVAETRRRR